MKKPGGQIKIVRLPEFRQPFRQTLPVRLRLGPPRSLVPAGRGECWLVGLIGRGAAGRSGSARGPRARPAPVIAYTAQTGHPEPAGPGWMAVLGGLATIVWLALPSDQEPAVGRWPTAAAGWLGCAWCTAWNRAATQCQIQDQPQRPRNVCVLGLGRFERGECAHPPRAVSAARPDLPWRCRVVAETRVLSTCGRHTAGHPRARVRSGRLSSGWRSK
jgi:hypothetical protein